MYEQDQIKIIPLRQRFVLEAVLPYKKTSLHHSTHPLYKNNVHIHREYIVYVMLVMTVIIYLHQIVKQKGHLFLILMEINCKR